MFVVEKYLGHSIVSSGKATTWTCDRTAANGVARIDLSQCHSHVGDGPDDSTGRIGQEILHEICRARTWSVQRKARTGCAWFRASELTTFSWIEQHTSPRKEQAWSVEWFINKSPVDQSQTRSHDVLWLQNQTHSFRPIHPLLYMHHHGLTEVHRNRDAGHLFYRATVKVTTSTAQDETQNLLATKSKAMIQYSRSPPAPTITNLCHDLYFLIAAYSSPQSLLALAQTCRRLYDFLNSPEEARAIWAEAEKAIGIPPCPLDLDSLQYARYVFSIPFMGIWGRAILIAPWKTIGQALFDYQSDLRVWIRRRKNEFHNQACTELTRRGYHRELFLCDLDQHEWTVKWMALLNNIMELSSERMSELVSELEEIVNLRRVLWLARRRRIRKKKVLDACLITWMGFRRKSILGAYPCFNAIDVLNIPEVQKALENDELGEDLPISLSFCMENTLSELHLSRWIPIERQLTSEVIKARGSLCRPVTDGEYVPGYVLQHATTLYEIRSPECKDGEHRLMTFQDICEDLDREFLIIHNADGELAGRVAGRRWDWDGTKYTVSVAAMRVAEHYLIKLKYSLNMSMPSMYLRQFYLVRGFPGYIGKVLYWIELIQHHLNFPQQEKKLLEPAATNPGDFPYMDF